MLAKCFFTGFLPLFCGAALFADGSRLADSAANKLSAKTGILTLQELGGVCPQTPVALASDVFNSLQMEGTPAKLSWKENGPGTFSTLLNAASAGADLAGVEYVKTFSFDETVPEVNVIMKFRNTSKKLRYAAWGSKSEFMLRPNAFEQVYLPSVIGTFPYGNGLFMDYYSQPSPWVSSPVENWCAKLNPATGSGILFLGGKIPFSTFYSKGGKMVGFLFDGGYLPPGETFHAEYSIRPLKGLSGITTANRNFAAHIASDGKQTVHLRIYSYATGSLAGKIQLRNEHGEEFLVKPIELNLEKGKMTDYKLTQPKPKGHTIIRFSGTMNGAPFETEQYCENGFRMQSLPACGFAPCLTRPERKTADAAETAFSGGEKREKKAICFFGLYTNFNRFDQILGGWKIDDYSVESPTMKRIPPASSIDEYSVMILGNAFAHSLEVCLKRIHRFVLNGGVLIVTGGPSSFGTGGYDKNPVLRGILPFECTPFDLHPAAGEIAKGAAIRGTKTNVYWIHDGIKLKPGAKVLLSTESGKPLLIKGNCGKGIVLCWLATPLGNPPAGSVPYWESEEYIKIMRGVVDSVLMEVRK